MGELVTNCRSGKTEGTFTEICSEEGIHKRFGLADVILV